MKAPPLRPPLVNTSAPRDGEPSAEETEKLRRWQEERIGRKLRGEYESYVRNLNELVRSQFCNRIQSSGISHSFGDRAGTNPSISNV